MINVAGRSSRRVRLAWHRPAALRGRHLPRLPRSCRAVVVIGGSMIILVNLLVDILYA
jgi:hypothetical protein